MKTFEKLVQEISSKGNHKVDEETEKLVIYRPRTGEYFYQSNYFDRVFNTSDRHFIVNYNQFEKIEGLECEVFDPKANSEIKLKVTCVVGCIRSKAHKLVKLVSKSNDLETAVRDLFVNWTNAFIDISNESIKKDFTEIDGKLRSHYEEYAASRGIRLTIIRIDLDDETGEFLEGFSFATDKDEDPNYEEDKFHTKEADVDVRLRINVSGKGESLGGNLPKYNRKGKSLIKEIKLQTIEFVRHWMRKISPEEIYMSDRDKKLDELVSDLTKYYRTEFNVFSPSFSLSVLDTEPKLRVESLMSQEGKICVEDATEDIKYDIIYSVVGVSNWSKFILRQKRYFGHTHEEYATLTELMHNEIERGVNRSYGAKMEWLKTDEFDDFIRGLYKKAAIEVVDAQFGLVLGTPNLRRHTTVEETNPVHEAMRKIDIQKMKRKQLLEQLEEYELSGDMEEEIEEIETKLLKVNAKMKVIRKELPPSTPTGENLNNNLNNHERLTD
jgi:hypothetical protein